MAFAAYLAGERRGMSHVKGNIQRRMLPFCPIHGLDMAVL